MISKKELYKLYIEKNLGSKKISEIYGVSHTTILNWVDYYGIKKKPPGNQGKKNIKIKKEYEYLLKEENDKDEK